MAVIKSGEVPIGCVIVHEGKIIGRGYNRRNTDKNTLAHAEITAINKASKVIGDWRLEECTLYVTLEPCQMCAGAIVQARIPEVVMGCMNPKAGCAGSILNILEMPQFNHQVKVTRGILETDKNTLAHAEITAINKASKVIGDWRLEECTLYVTLEPCQMCAGAIVQARIPEVVMGCMNPKAGCAGSILNILEMPQFNHQVKVTRGILETECSQMLKTFFEELRIRNKQEKAARKASGDLS